MDIRVPIVIPAYEPDERLLQLLDTIPMDDNYIIMVDDGSGESYDSIFVKAQEKMGENGVVLHHEVNKGKGRALKTAFAYVLENMPDAIGVVTADSDGQHTIKAIEDVSEALKASPASLVMGVRTFGGDDIPWKSRFGNNITIKVMQLTTGIKVSDTQTGLRGIPAPFMRELLDVPGERFEFEMEMLVQAKNRYPFKEVPIETIYDSKENHQTHFRPVVDSIKIYSILGKRFAKFAVASLSSCILDILLFTLFCYFLRTEEGLGYVTVATVLARVLSATYNYTINNIIVFKSKDPVKKTLPKYAALACIQMVFSAGLVTLGKFVFGSASETIIKIIVDSILFVASYNIQKLLVF